MRRTQLRCCSLSHQFYDNILINTMNNIYISYHFHRDINVYCSCFQQWTKLNNNKTKLLFLESWEPRTHTSTLFLLDSYSILLYVILYPTMPSLFNSKVSPRMTLTTNILTWNILTYTKIHVIPILLNLPWSKLRLLKFNNKNNNNN